MGISRLTDIHSYSSFWKLLVKASVSLLMSGPLPHSLLYKCVYKASGLPGKVENKSLITNKKNKTWSATSSFQGTRVFTYISCMPGCQEKTQIVVFNFLGYHTKTWVSLWYFSTYNHHPLVLFIPSTPTSLPGSFSFLLFFKISSFPLMAPILFSWSAHTCECTHIHKCERKCGICFSNSGLFCSTQCQFKPFSCKCMASSFKLMKFYVYPGQVSLFTHLLIDS